MVDLRRFGCSRGGSLRNFPNSLMKCVGQVVALVGSEVRMCQV
jgi:hypothetical protein